MKGLNGRKWIDVEHSENENLERMMDHYDALISSYMNMIPLSDVLSSAADDEDGTMGKLINVYKDTLSLCNDAFNYMIAQDKLMTTINKQNQEILDKLDKLTEEKKTK